jgi:hypothetical protein
MSLEQSSLETWQVNAMNHYGQSVNYESNGWG